jgi:hypothetical protein
MSSDTKNFINDIKDKLIETTTSFSDIDDVEFIINGYKAVESLTMISCEILSKLQAVEKSDEVKELMLVKIKSKLDNHFNLITPQGKSFHTYSPDDKEFEKSFFNIITDGTSENDDLPNDDSGTKISGRQHFYMSEHEKKEANKIYHDFIAKKKE